MLSVLLQGLNAYDPAGSRAVRQALVEGLPNHYLRDLSAYPDAAARLSATRRSSALVLTGAAFPRSAASAAAMSGVTGRPLIFFGARSGPLQGPAARAAARRAVRQARLLLLADEQSASNLASAGAPSPMRVAADPAWLGLTSVSPAGSRGESVAVAVDGRIDARAERALGEALVTVAGTGRRVLIFPWHPADRVLAANLARTVERAVPGAATVEETPETMAEAADRFGQAHAVVALRPRAVQAAAAASVPVVGIGVDPDTAVVATSVGQTVIPPFSISTGLPIALERIGAGDTPDRATVRDEIDRARAGLRLLRLVLEPEAVAAADVDHLPLVPVPWLS